MIGARGRREREVAAPRRRRYGVKGKSRGRPREGVTRPDKANARSGKEWAFAF